VTTTTRLSRSTPAEQGLSARALRQLIEDFDDDFDFHSLMVVRNGFVVAEGWWEPFTANNQHMLFSLSKSVTATAIGLAIAEQLLSLDTRVSDILGAGDFTVEHLLTMTAGWASDPLEKTAAGSWVQGILAAPLEYGPGEHFFYTSGSTYLLSAIITRVTGESLTEYLRPRLFDPLGIENPDWERSPEGIDTGGFGLSLTTEDAAKFGLLYLQRGQWEGEQLLPETWVDAATSARVSTAGDPDNALGYGYQFWRSQHGYRGDGAFGQLCVIIPEHELVIVTTGALPNTQAALTSLWHHLPAILEADDSDDRMPHLGLETVQGAQRESETRRFTVDNRDLDAFALTHGETSSTFEWWAGDNPHTIVCGHGYWAENRVKFQGVEHDAVASSAWVSDEEWTAHVQFLGKPWRYEIRLRFADDDVEVTIDQNVSFGQTRLLAATGRAE
jgi:CubicO group peptidase (beta-lactamase class C family)